MTWLTKSTEEISDQVPKFGMLQLKSIKPDDNMDEIEFDKFNDSNVLEGKNHGQEVLVQEIENEDMSEEEDEDEEEYQVKTRASTKASVKLPRELRNLDTYYNPILYTQEEQVDLLLLSAGTGIDDPEKFEDAWDHPNPVERTEWRQAIKKELTDMHVKRQIWKKIPIKNVPEGRKLIGSKWVFKKKKNRIFRARLCALGYSQITGVDSTKNLATVVTK